MEPSKDITAPVGESVRRVDALEKVTGEALFTDDLPFGPGLLYGRVVRSPHPHCIFTGSPRRRTSTSRR